MADNLPEKRKYGVPEYRDKIVRRLETAYADNKLELEEYERRLDLAYKAEEAGDHCKMGHRKLELEYMGEWLQ